MSRLKRAFRSGTVWAAVLLVLLPGAFSCRKDGPDPVAPPEEETVVALPWMELPGSRGDVAGKYKCLTHRMSLGGKEVRNFTYYWDYGHLVSRWVAYPLNKAYIGNGTRSNAWGLDPNLPEAEQPVLYTAYTGLYGYARGHQIPSADRLNREANIQTFYGTNMTPQDYDFNGETWALLESRVRGWATLSDTLYVLTGCLVDGSRTLVRDNAGKTVTVPTGYYKALLRYMPGSTFGYEGYSGIAFYFDNKRQLDASGNVVNITADLALSLSEMEDRLGFTLFESLSRKVGAETARKIKDQDPATVPWWWKN